MVQISATVEHDERTSDELGPVVLHDEIYSLETLPSVIEWCARRGNGGHGANGRDCGDIAIGVNGVNASAAHEGFAGQCGGNGATEDRPRAVPMMARRRTGITYMEVVSDQANRIESETKTKNEWYV
eukprot:scaffold92217_cov29-Attheya_sp.AAC.3